ncbi:MAG: hypothetical protein ACW99U_03665 [Candidatus Thorarchaeota archaeon]|jgi:hypothetical protein
MTESDLAPKKLIAWGFSRQTGGKLLLYQLPKWCEMEYYEDREGKKFMSTRQSNTVVGALHFLRFVSAEFHIVDEDAKRAFDNYEDDLRHWVFP